MKNMPLPAEVYARIFDGTPEGQQILEELVTRFGGNPYVRGGHEADRETCYRAGSNRVVNFILGRINTANGAPADPGEDGD